MNFYGSLMGKKEDNLEGINLVTMRSEAYLRNDQRERLVKHVTDKEIGSILKGIGDLKAIGVDGYEMKFFKSTWNTVKSDVTGDVREFFLN